MRGCKDSEEPLIKQKDSKIPQVVHLQNKGCEGMGMLTLEVKCNKKVHEICRLKDSVSAKQNVTL